MWKTWSTIQIHNMPEGFPNMDNSSAQLEIPSQIRCSLYVPSPSAKHEVAWICLFSLDSKISTLSIIRKLLLLETAWFNGAPSILRSPRK